MPKIYAYHCDTCDFTMPFGEGKELYVIDDKGQRVLCSHPGEAYDIERVTGLSVWEARAQGKVGNLSSCICPECLHQGKYDVLRDSLICPACSTAKLRPANLLLGKLCPNCKEGTFTRTWNGVKS